MNDTELNRMLHAWKVEEYLPPSFPSEVWRRIEAAGSTTPAGAPWLESFLVWLARPLPAAASWSLALTLGLIAGGMTIDNSQAVDFAANYAHSISPLAKIAAP